jgi:hypothetical protein
MTFELELARMNKRRPKIIRDNKRRGEWAESVFVARAVENGLEISKAFWRVGDLIAWLVVQGSSWRCR